MSLKIVRSGFLTTIQDLGRVGFRQFGVSSGGALDLHAMRIANLLVGNEESAAGLEITQGNVRLRFGDERIISWCGGDYEFRVASYSIPAGHSMLVSAEDELFIAGPWQGCRAWLAVSGGVAVPLVLGSRSTDLRGNFGGLHGRAVRDGDSLPLGKNSKRTRIWMEDLRAERIARWSAPEPWSQTASANPILRVIRGADWNRFNPPSPGDGVAGDVSIQRFTSEAFAASPDSDRMGVRFDCPELKRNDDVELISEAVAPGTIQVPPNGKPILLLGDCQTIGGYPKIAHVITVDLSIAAQLRAGDQVRFSEVSLADAHRLLLERESELKRFRIGLSLHTS
jgi:antagonist of KipI